MCNINSERWQLVSAGGAKIKNKEHACGLKGDFLDSWRMSEKLFSSRMSAASVTTCQLPARSRIHWPHTWWVVTAHAYVHIVLRYSCPLPWRSGSASPSAAEPPVVIAHEQSCTQPWLLLTLLPLRGNPQLQDLAPTNQVSNWQFVTLESAL